MKHDVMAAYGYHSWHLDAAMEKRLSRASRHLPHRVYSCSDDVICDSLRKIGVTKFLEELSQFDVFGSAASLMVGRVKFITDPRVGWVHNSPYAPSFAAPTSVTGLCLEQNCRNDGYAVSQEAKKLGPEMGVCVCQCRMVFPFFRNAQSLANSVLLSCTYRYEFTKNGVCFSFFQTVQKMRQATLNLTVWLPARQQQLNLRFQKHQQCVCACVCIHYWWE